MANRIRNNPVQVYFSDEEIKSLNKRMEELGTDNQSNFIRKMVLDGYIIRIDDSLIREMTSLLRRCSNNLNQYAKMANATGSFYAEDIESIKQEQAAIWALTRKMLTKLSGL